MEIKSNEPNLTQKQISKQLGCSDSTFKRYRHDTQMDCLTIEMNTERKILSQIPQ